MHNVGTGNTRHTLLQYGRSYHAVPVARKPRYTGPLNPPSEATLAKRAAEARTLSRGTCSTCHMLLPATGECC